MVIPGDSGFQYFEIRYVWQCRACGVEHETRPPRNAPGTAPWIPSVPKGWLVLTQYVSGQVTSAYCPGHKIVIQDNVVNVHAKDEEVINA